jgi:hypothetical protein
MDAVKAIGYLIPPLIKTSIFYDEIGQDEDMDSLYGGTDCSRILSSGEKEV